nr:hypothetical protein [Tanacetum cinerariifolium]
MMPESLVAHDGFMSKEELEYMHASNVNVSNFVSAKLSGNSNYHIWRAQMLSLMDSLMMRGIIDNEYEWPGPNKSAKIAEKYEILLQGWIFGTLQEEVLRHVVYDTNTRYIWRKLRDLYLFGVRDPIKGTNRGTELVRIFVPEDENDDITQLKKKLCNIVLEGNWWKAKSILKRHKFPISKEINNDGDTMLHLAVAEGNNYFVQKLLQFIHDGKLIEKQNVNGQTALHVAAIVGNKYAAELLVKKRKELLRIQDHDGREPLLSAYSNKQLNTFAYLLEVSDTTQKWLPIHLDSYKMFKIGLIYRQEYDLVLKLDRMYDNWEMQTVETLMAVTRNFPSDLSFWEAMIYPDGNNATLEQIKKKSKWKNDEYVCRVSYAIDKLFHSWNDFKNYLKHIKEELSLVELGSHLCIEESPKEQNYDKPKSKMLLAFQLSIW